MATISTAPTPFDQVSKEELNDWLGHPVTNKLLEACEQNRIWIEDRILHEETGRSSDSDIANWYRGMREMASALTNVIEWIKGAHRA